MCIRDSTYGVLMGSRSALTVEGTITSTDSYAITGNGAGSYDNTLCLLYTSRCV